MCLWRPLQLVVKHERGLVSLKLPSTEDVDEMVAHIGSILQTICPSLSPRLVLSHNLRSNLLFIF